MMVAVVMLHKTVLSLFLVVVVALSLLCFVFLFLFVSVLLSPLVILMHYLYFRSSVFTASNSRESYIGR